MESLGAAGGFSGARFWRLETARGPYCLRRWPESQPDQQRLEFIHSVLWYVHQEEFDLVPVPVETIGQQSYVWGAGHLWELAPWMPGTADYLADPQPQRLRAALLALARFHRASQTFPVAEQQPAVSPGIVARRRRLQTLMRGDLESLRRSILPGQLPALEPRADRLFTLFPHVAPRVARLLDRAANEKVSLQPCLRDIWSDHVLFEGTRVTGIIDFGALRADNVSTDVARLLGSLAGDDLSAWQQGLTAYASIRPIAAAERVLIEAFDQSTVLLAGINWIDWIYRQRLTFENSAAIPERLDTFLVRLEKLV